MSLLIGMNREIATDGGWTSTGAVSPLVELSEFIVSGELGGSGDLNGSSGSGLRMSLVGLVGLVRPGWFTGLVREVYCETRYDSRLVHDRGDTQQQNRRIRISIYIKPDYVRMLVR